MSRDQESIEEYANRIFDEAEKDLLRELRARRKPGSSNCPMCITRQVHDCIEVLKGMLCDANTKLRQVEAIQPDHCEGHCLKSSVQEVLHGRTCRALEFALKERTSPSILTIERDGVTHKVVVSSEDTGLGLTGCGLSVLPSDEERSEPLTCVGCMIRKDGK